MKRTRLIGYGISIIRINNHKLGEIAFDQENLRNKGYDLTFEVPVIQIITQQKQVRLQNLLLNYGFMIVPLKYLRDMDTLQSIRQQSTTLNSFFYRKGAVQNSAALEVPVLLETVSVQKLEEIMEASDKISESYNSKELGEGEYIILSDKPFQGLMAQVLNVSGNKVKVKLMIGADFVLELNKSYINYQKVYNVSQVSHSKEFISNIVT